MSDKKTFPMVEPPPHPEGDSQSQNVQGSQPTAINASVANSQSKTITESISTPSPFDVMEPAPQEESADISQSGKEESQNFSQQQPVEISQSLKPPSKKGFPKILLFVVGGLLAIILILVVVNAIKSGRNTILVGTKGQLTWWGIHDESEIVSPLIEEYQKQNPNVKINYVKQSEADYRERLTSALASGEGPDIFEMHNSWEPMFRADLSSAPSSVLSKEDFSKSFYSVISSDLVKDAGIIGMPLEYDALTLYINDDIFTSALKPVPRTWDELETTAKELTQVGPNSLILQAGVPLGLMDNVDHWQEIVALMLLQNGVNLAKPQEQFTRDVILFYLNFYRVDRVWNSSLPDSTNAFARGKVAMYFAPTLKAEKIREENSSLRFRTTPLPQLPKERPNDPDISYATYWAQAVYKRSTNSEIAWDFLKFLSSPASLQEFNRLRREKGQLERAYPRPEMAALQKDDKILGSVLTLAPHAKSWYLADETFDGPTGINSQINKIYQDVLEAVLGNKDLNVVLRDLPAKINGVIAKYNTAKR